MLDARVVKWSHRGAGVEWVRRADVRGLLDPGVGAGLLHGFVAVMLYCVTRYSGVCRCYASWVRCMDCQAGRVWRWGEEHPLVLVPASIADGRVVVTSGCYQSP
jgi:hypothetical protein